MNKRIQRRKHEGQIKGKNKEKLTKKEKKEMNTK